MKSITIYILLLVAFIACTPKKKTMKDPFCDPETGVCTPANLEEMTTSKSENDTSPLEIIYVGDPMCSWCWGISKDLEQLKNYHENNGGKFTIVVGGLRPGGGDPWDYKMKSFLKHHWEEVTARSGQPFGYEIFKRDSFNYNTEPSCRAVVVSRDFTPEKELEFFEAVQEKFYVQNEDPNEVDFYESICVKFGINYPEFKTKFLSTEAKKKTHNEFALNRQWGVKGYPSILVKQEEQLYLIANGYAEFPELKERVDELSQKK